MRSLPLQSKLHTVKTVSEKWGLWSCHDARRPIKLCTGAFDLLHLGHVQMLETAFMGSRTSGTVIASSLIVGVNSDESIRRIKGLDRPIVPEVDRAWMLAALQVVDGVFIFDEDTVTKTLLALRPAIWLKGGDWTLKTLNQDERKAAESIGTEIVILPRIGEYSTTGVIERMKR